MTDQTNPPTPTEIIEGTKGRLICLCPGPTNCDASGDGNCVSLATLRACAERGAAPASGEGVYAVRPASVPGPHEFIATDAPSGETAELVERLNGAARALDALGPNTPEMFLLSEAAAALSRQSAELAEARERLAKLEADDSLEGMSRRLRGFVNELKAIPRFEQTASAALLSLGCKLGPGGWMKPVCDECGASQVDESSCDYQCNGKDDKWLPIPPSPSAGEGGKS